MTKNRAPAFTSIVEATESEIQAVLNRHGAKSELYGRMDAVEVKKGFALEGDLSRIKTKVAAWNVRHKNDGRHFVCAKSVTTGRILVVRDK